jgi:methionyl aminopeptidase
VVREFIGHGIGDQFHTSLQIPHYYDPRNDGVLLEGMTFTVEPMINLGSDRLDMWDDGWTVATRDLQRSAQFEHTVLVTDSGFELLTVPASGEPAEVRFAGVRMGLDGPSRDDTATAAVAD